ncbi:MAG TPA: NUDIX domain-containing protein [Candidatus Bathyarchaeota archaeon]|nr:NUDIX domain-containing protein [Candidatus Bathyarchaeota archaeon]HEW89828.1 NUDIX domain-containing protein [Candidatus Bathyarchaeota archaeon]
MRAPVPSASALVQRGRYVLLVRRGREPEADSWSLPAGLVEIGETVEEATKREVFEETGIEVEVKGLLGVYDLMGAGYHYVVICFRCEPLNLNVRPGADVEDARWWEVEELAGLKLMSTTAEALSDAGLLPKPLRSRRRI